MTDWAWLIFVVPSMLLSSTVHEFAHALAASKLGDDTARSEGRLTLNPIAHIDPLGLLAMVIFKIGWAKPVPINPYNFEKPVRDEALVAFAGPLSNMLLVLVSCGVHRLFSFIFPNEWVFIFIEVFILVNASLAIFNLIPIPPLDGHRLLKLVVPRSWREAVEGLEKYSLLLILLIVLPFSPLRPVINVVFGTVFDFIYSGICRYLLDSCIILG